MVLKTITVNKDSWDTSFMPNLSYMIPKTVHLGMNRYNISFKYNNAVKRK